MVTKQQAEDIRTLANSCITLRSEGTSEQYSEIISITDWYLESITEGYTDPVVDTPATPEDIMEVYRLFMESINE